jgi:hypothetical protein
MRPLFWKIACVVALLAFVGHMVNQPGSSRPVFTSAEQVFEYHDAFLYQKSDEGCFSTAAVSRVW